MTAKSHTVCEGVVVILSNWSFKSVQHIVLNMLKGTPWWSKHFKSVWKYNTANRPKVKHGEMQACKMAGCGKQINIFDRNLTECSWPNPESGLGAYPASSCFENNGMNSAAIPTAFNCSSRRFWLVDSWSEPTNQKPAFVFAVFFVIFSQD